MFPFGIFPFNVMQQFSNPWWMIQAQDAKEGVPPMFKASMDAYAAWMAIMSKGNPWMDAYNKMLQDNPFVPPQMKK